MKSKKVTMIAAALVVAVVALAGVGYATQYTAQTTNSDNNAAVAYITVSQTGTGVAYDSGSWLTKVFFDTTNPSSGSFTYTLIKEWAYGTGETATTITNVGKTTGTMALISESLGIVIQGVNSDDDDVDITVSTSGLTPVYGLTYTLVLASAVTHDSTSGDITSITRLASDSVALANSTDTWTGPATWTFSDVTISDMAAGETFYLLMFIEGGASLTASPSSTAGFGTDCSFSILVTAEE